MVLFPNCKINLGLSVINKRKDGFHNLETIFYPLAVKDVLEIIPASQEKKVTISGRSSDAVQFSTSGLTIEGISSDNLCLKAYSLLQNDFPQLAPIQMHLHKAIPMGAGLGGGSADGAFVLQMLNTQFKLALSTTQLKDYAAKLGSDCPFFIINQPCFATGRGENLEPVTLDLSAYLFVLVNAGISINTGWAFSQLTSVSIETAVRSADLREIIRDPVSEWRTVLHNDFEKPVFQKFPEIKLIKDRLYEKGARFASMTGSGSTVYGIFDKQTLPDFNFPKDYLVIQVSA